jgi:hypothetical protein
MVVSAFGREAVAALRLGALEHGLFFPVAMPPLLHARLERSAAAQRPPCQRHERPERYVQGRTSYELGSSRGHVSAKCCRRPTHLHRFNEAASGRLGVWQTRANLLDSQGHVLPLSPSRASMSGARSSQGRFAALRETLLFMTAAITGFLAFASFYDRSPTVDGHVGSEARPLEPSAAPALRPDLPTPRSLQEPLKVAEAPLEMSENLSAFERESLKDQQGAGQLNTELISALHGPYQEALRCSSDPAHSALEYQFFVEAHGPTARVRGARFDRIKSGAPLDAEVIACVTRALSRPFDLHAPPQGSFPKSFEGEIPIEISIFGRAPSAN